MPVVNLKSKSKSNDVFFDQPTLGISGENHRNSFEFSSCSCAHHLLLQRSASTSAPECSPKSLSSTAPGAGGDKVLYMTLDKFGELKLKVTAAARNMSLTREKNNKFKFYRHGRQGVSPGVPLFPDNVSSLQVIIHQLN